LLIANLKIKLKNRTKRIYKILKILIMFTKQNDGKTMLIQIKDIVEILLNLLPEFEEQVYYLLRNLVSVRENKIFFIANG
jgi:hypothetical protein